MSAILELEEPTLRMNNANRISCEQRSSDTFVADLNPVRAGNLYRYLEMEQLIDAFAERLNSVVTIDTLRFKNTILGQSIDKNFTKINSISAVDRSDHLLEYSLGDQQYYLGSLCIARHKQFLSAEVRRVNASVDALVGPLRNATMYLRVCQSAYLDTLTGVQNRAALDDMLSGPMKQGNCAALMICDVDRFKAINDNCGHKSGDAVLRQFAEILRSSIRKTDVVYRYGGDEFVVILNDNTLDGARDSAERIRKSIEQGSLQMGNACINLTTTIGLTGLKPGESLDEAFLRADAALLVGKKNGKNKVVCG